MWPDNVALPHTMMYVLPVPASFLDSNEHRDACVQSLIPWNHALRRRRTTYYSSSSARERCGSSYNRIVGPYSRQLRR